LKLAPGVKLQAITSGPRFHFFGYFDKSPWLAEPGADIALAHEAEVHAKPPEPDDAVAVGSVDLESGGAFTRLAESRAWNFQQGAMLQWLPGRCRTVVFNDRREHRAVGVVLEIGSGATRMLDQPVAALSRQGGMALSVNFGRLNSTARGYGYAGVADPVADDPCPENDGIWTVDLATGAARLLLSTRAIATFGEHGNPPGAYHWVNHLQFNTDDTRFCFLHRCCNPAGTIYTRLLTCKPDGSGLRLLLCGMASHFDWRSEDELVIWAGERKLLDSTVHGSTRRLPVGQALRFFYRLLGKPRFLKQRLLKDRYMVINARTGEKRTVAHPRLNSDGHCSFSPDRKWMLTDTYPDRNRRVSLLLYYWESGRVLEVGEFTSPPELEDEVRCDLHPRWSPDGSRVCIDSAHEGRRQMYVLDIKALVAAAQRS